MERKDIQIISRRSNWSKDGVEQALKEHVHSDATAWKKFLQLLFITLGAGFTVAGIVFFFAYNWANLHKFAKMGIIQGLVIGMTCFVLFSKFNWQIKNIILTATAVTLGVLFAVFGQIYQTGANAYDFFFGWTAAITLWVLIASFPPLWLIYLMLVNTTFVLYAEQVATGLSETWVINILFIFNTIVLIFSLYLPIIYKEAKVPTWFTQFLALAVVTLATIGIAISIFEPQMPEFSILFFATIGAYGLGVNYGFKEKRIFYLAIIAFSIIIIIAAFIIKISEDIGAFFLITLFIVGSVTMLIKYLLSLQKQWKSEA